MTTKAKRGNASWLQSSRLRRDVKSGVLRVRVGAIVLSITFAGLFGDSRVAFGEDPALNKFIATFSDDAVLYGDIYYGKVTLVLSERRRTNLPQAKIRISLVDRGWVLDEDEAWKVVCKGKDVEIAGQISVPKMFVATGLRRKRNKMPVFDYKDGLLRVKFVNTARDKLSMLGMATEGLGPAGALAENSYFVNVRAGFTCKEEFLNSDEVLDVGTLGTTSTSVFSFPVKGFAFAVKDFDELSLAINKCYSDLCRRPSLLGGLSFPIDDQMVKGMINKPDNSSNLATLISTSRIYVDALGDNKLSDDQFIDKCVAILATTKPVAREWLADSMDVHLGEVRIRARQTLRRRLESTKW